MLLTILALCCLIVAVLISVTVERSWGRFFVALGLALMLLASMVGGGSIVIR